MWVVKYQNPFGSNIVTKKFMGIYAWEHAMNYSNEVFNNYYHGIDVWGNEIYKGKKTGRIIRRNHDNNVYDKMFTETPRVLMFMLDF